MKESDFGIMKNYIRIGVSNILIFNITCIFVLIIFSGIAKCQKIEYVIAPNGINFRKSPSLKSKIIDVLKFRDSVEVIEKNLYLIDTLYQVKNSGDYFMCFNNIEYFGKGNINIIGSWIKVLANDNTGYIVDTYIYKDKPKSNKIEVIYFDRDNTTWELNFDPSQYYWYSLANTNNEIVLIKSYPDFINVCSEYSGELIAPVYDNMDNSIGLIGTRTSFQERLINDAIVDSDFNHESSTERKFVKLSGPELTYGQHLRDSSWVYEYTSSRDKITEIFKFTEGASQPIKVRFVGDIDNDGEKDYIIWSHTVYDLFEMTLYLSTNRSNDGIYIKSSSSYLDYD